MFKLSKIFSPKTVVVGRHLHGVAASALNSLNPPFYNRFTIIVFLGFDMLPNISYTMMMVP